MNRAVGILGRILFVLMLLQMSSAHAIRFSKKTWCDGWLSREPREMAVFKADLKGILQKTYRVNSHESKERNSDYDRDQINGIRSLFERPRYAEMTPELKARLISYILVEWVPIPKYRSNFAIIITEWLNEVLNKEPGFSTTDLDRLRVSYSIFLERRATYTTRLDGFTVLPGLLCVAGDALATLGIGVGILHCALNVAAIPHLGFIPVPLFIGGSVIRNIIFRNTGEPLTSDANKGALALENRFYQLIGSQVPVKELTERWDLGLKSALTKQQSEATPGLFKSLATDYCKLVGSAQNGEKAHSIKLLLHMTKTFAQVNPVEWQAIRDIFQIIRSTAMGLGLTQAEAAPILDEMTRIAATWTANSAATRSVEELLKQSWEQQKLPEQQ